MDIRLAIALKYKLINAYQSEPIIKKFKKIFNFNREKKAILNRSILKMFGTCSI